MRAAIYARYSTEQQSANSIDDQIRVCERLAERHGCTVVERFSDAAISGGTSERPAYQAMLTAARRREFDVIVAEDTSRLWRNMAEQAPRLASVSAETDCSLLPINRAAFLALVESSPEFAASLLTALAERLRRLTARLQ